MTINTGSAPSLNIDFGSHVQDVDIFKHFKNIIPHLPTIYLQRKILNPRLFGQFHKRRRFRSSSQNTNQELDIEVIILKL